MLASISVEQQFLYSAEMLKFNDNFGDIKEAFAQEGYPLPIPNASYSKGKEQLIISNIFVFQSDYDVQFQEVENTTTSLNVVTISFRHPLISFPMEFKYEKKTSGNGNTREQIINGSAKASIQISDFSLQKEFSIYKGKLIYNMKSLTFSIGNIAFLSFVPYEAKAYRWVCEVVDLTEFKENIFFSIYNKLSDYLLKKYENQSSQSKEIHYVYKENQDIVLNGTCKKIKIENGYFYQIFDYQTINFPGEVISVPSKIEPENGRLQYILSSSLINNSVQYAFQKHYFDSNLNKTNWKESLFDFTIGDISLLCPDVLKYFPRELEIDGKCTLGQIRNFSVSSLFFLFLGFL